MTRRDCVLIAAAIRHEADQWPQGGTEWHAIQQTAISIAHALKAENSLFNFDVFYEAAGVK